MGGIAPFFFAKDYRMSRKLLFVVLIGIVLNYGEGNAQDAYAINLGGVVSQMSGDNYQGFKKFGVVGGVDVLFRLKSLSAPKLEMEKNEAGEQTVSVEKKGSKKSGYYFSAGVEYFQKGAQDRRNEEEGDFNWYILKADYIQAPFRFWIPYRGVYFIPGIDFSYNINWDQSNNGIPAGELANQRLIEMGLSASVNFEVNQYLQLQAMFFHSLTPVTSSSVDLTNWFRQGGMHSGLSLRAYVFLGRTKFNWKNSGANDVDEDSDDD